MGFGPPGSGRGRPGFRRCFVKARPWQMGPAKKDMAPSLSASLFTALLSLVKRGAGVTRGLVVA